MHQEFTNVTTRSHPVEVALPDRTVHLRLSRGKQAARSITNDLHVSIARSLHENVPLSSIVHHLSGPNMFALIHNTLKITVGSPKTTLKIMVSCAHCAVPRRLNPIFTPDCAIPRRLNPIFAPNTEDHDNKARVRALEHHDNKARVRDECGAYCL